MASNKSSISKNKKANKKANKRINKKTQKRTKPKPKNQSRKVTKGKTKKTRKISKVRKIKKVTKPNKSCPMINKCAPHIREEYKESGKCPNTCFDREALLKISKAWNQDNPQNPINIYKTISNTILKNNIDTKLRDKCKDEWCWIQQEFIKRLRDDEILRDTFIPTMPDKWYQHKTEWLNTLDIDSVLSQYEIKHPDFMFIGPVPIDFDEKINFSSCVADELCKINLKKLSDDDIRKVGVVFNLDTHDKPGSHWVAMFCDMNKKGIYYWDSYGYQAPRQVKKLMKRLKKQGQDLNIDFKIKENDVRHQYKNSECGVYCINFIVNLLEGKSFEQYIKKRIPDNTMNNMRKKYFIKDPVKNKLLGGRQKSKNKQKID